MAQEILGVKLCQLDEKISQLHSHIRQSQLANPDQLCRELETVRRECAATETALREKLEHSKSSLVSVLAQGYREAEQIIQEEQVSLRQHFTADPPSALEEQLLTAEYALDFAYLASERALLLSLEAIAAEQSQPKEGDSE